MRNLTMLGLATFSAACAGGSAGTTQAPAPQPQPQAPAPAAQQVMRQAAAAEAPKAKDIDPTGTYDVNLTYAGQAMTVSLRMYRKADGNGYTGTLSAEAAPAPLPLTNVVVSGKKVTGNLASPDGSAISMEFTIDGDNLTGSWKSNAGDGSTMIGKRTGSG